MLIKQVQVSLRTGYKKIMQKLWQNRGSIIFCCLEHTLFSILLANNSLVMFFLREMNLFVSKSLQIFFRAAKNLFHETTLWKRKKYVIISLSSCLNFLYFVVFQQFAMKWVTKV